MLYIRFMETEEEFVAWQVNSNYLISNLGNIRSLYYNMILTQSLDSRGYKQVFLKTTDQCQGKCFKVHRLVAEAFICRSKGLTDVVLIDKNKLNVCSGNTRWVTHSQALRHNKSYVAGDFHWSKGKIASRETRSLLSAAKTGILHPKFKGYYVIRGAKFASATEASLATGISKGIILRKCASYQYPGFGFEPA